MLKEDREFVLRKGARFEKYCYNLDQEDGFDQLRELNVTDCEDLEYLINTIPAEKGALMQQTVFPMVGSLHLKRFEGGIDGHPPVAAVPLGVRRMDFRNLPELTEVWSMTLPRRQGLQYLKVITVQGCPRLTSLLSPSIAKLLVQLEELLILDCLGMKYVIADEEGSMAADKIVFPSLVRLILQDLPKLTSFCQQKCNIARGRDLQVVKVCKCPELQVLPSTFRRFGKDGNGRIDYSDSPFMEPNKGTSEQAEPLPRMVVAVNGNGDDWVMGKDAQTTNEMVKEMEKRNARTDPSPEKALIRQLEKAVVTFDKGCSLFSEATNKMNTIMTTLAFDKILHERRTQF